MNKPEIITDEVKTNHSYFEQGTGDIMGDKYAIAELMFKDNNRYNAYKGDWQHTDWNGGGFTKMTTGRRDGKMYITREQINTDAIKAGAQRYRQLAEQGIHSPLDPIGPDGELQWMWVSLPNVIKQRISDQYFGGMSWNTVKMNRTTKAQWYMVIQREYPEYICYPGGKLPIPVDAPYPTKAGQTKYFKGGIE